MSWISNNGNLVTLVGGVIILIGSGIAYFGVYVTNLASDMKSDEIVAKSDEIAELSQKNAALSEKLTAYTTGGDSYVYIHIEGFGTDNPKAFIRHHGNYPVRDLEISFFNVTDQMADFDSGRIARYDLDASERLIHKLTVVHPEWKKIFQSFPLEDIPTQDLYAYFIYIESHNGSVRQHLRMAKVDGEWQQQYSVQRDVNDGIDVLVVHEDENFRKNQPERVDPGEVTGE